MKKIFNTIAYSLGKLKHWVIFQVRHNKFQFAFSGIIAFIGFILSPLSWWNDLFINVPIAYGFAVLMGHLLDIGLTITKPFFTALFALGYLISNIAGFLLIHYSVVSVADHGKNTISIREQVITSIVYTALIVLLGYFDIFSVFGEGHTIFPDFVQ
jgi:hypothetical protein